MARLQRTLGAALTVAACGATIPAYQGGVVKAPLQVVGRYLVDENLRPLTLDGVALPDDALTCDSGATTAATFAAMRRWNVAVVRIAVSLALWDDHSGACASYQRAVAATVASAQAAGLIALVTLRNGQAGAEAMAQTGATAFWRAFLSGAARNLPLLVEPFAQPQTSDAALWRDGGPVASATGTYQTVGMRQLIATINAAAPDVPVVVDGDAGGTDLTAAARRPLPGKQIIYAATPADLSPAGLARWAAMVAPLRAVAPLFVTGLTSASECQTGGLRAAIAQARMLVSGLVAGDWATASDPCAREALLATPEGTPSAYGAAVYAAFTARAVRVSGNQLLDINGAPLRFYGVTVSGLETDCTVGATQLRLNDFQAIRAWHANIVRLPISFGLWLSADPACDHYHLLVDQAIKNIEAQKMYVMVDVQSGVYPNEQMPDQGITTFLRQFLASYQSDPNLLLEVFGEPRNVTPAVWRDGGPLVSPGGVAFDAVGMQPLVTLVNELAPQTPVVVNGLNFGYDLSMVAAGYPITGANLVYGTHPYDFGNKQIDTYPSAFEYLTATHPVIAEEFGDTDDCDGSWLKKAMPILSERLSGMIAWGWRPEQDYCHYPSLITNIAGTPTPYGQPIHDFYLRATAAPNAHASLTTGAAVGAAG